MKKTFIIFSLFALIAVGCKQNKPTTANSPETDLYVPVQDTITNIGTNQTEIQQKKISVLVLPPADAISNAGSSPHIQEYLINALTMDSTLHLMKFPYKELKNIPYLHIFDKKYCKPIADKIETDIIIMSELATEFHNGHINFDQWHFSIKIYNTKTDKQINSRVKAKNLPYEKMKDFIMKNSNELITEIKTAYSAPDSTLIRINEIIAEEFSAKDLKYEITEKHDTTTENYSYTFKGDNYTKFSLTIKTFSSEQSAKQKIKELQEIKAKEEPFKVTFWYFRINNKLYSLSSTANIEHIKSKIYNRIIKEKQLKAEDTVVL